MKLRLLAVILVCAGLFAPSPSYATGFCLNIIKNLVQLQVKEPPTVKDGFFPPVVEGEKRGFIRKATQSLPVAVWGREVRPFEGLRNALIDKPIFAVSSFIGMSRVSGPVIRVPFSLVAGAISFSLWITPVYSGLDYYGEYKKNQNIELNAPYYDALIENDQRFIPVKLIKGKVDEKVLRQSAFAIRDYYASLYQAYFNSRLKLDDPTLLEKGEELLDKKSDVLTKGVTKSEGYIVPDNKVGPVSFENIEKLAKVQFELALKQEAAVLLINKDQGVFRERGDKRLKGFLPFMNELAADPFFKKMDSLYQNQALSQTDFLKIIQMDLILQSMFQQNQILGITKLQEVLGQDGQWHYTDKPGSIEDFRKVY